MLNRIKQAFPVLFLTTFLGAQSPLSFDVAAIKPSSPEARGTSLFFQPPNGIRVTNSSVKFLILFAYDIRDFQLSGGPGWVASDRFDINAKAEKKPGSEDVPDDPRKMTDTQLKSRQSEMRERMRSLLADRFQLTIHRESKEAPVYALVVVKSGSKLQPAQEGVDGPRGLRMMRGQLTATHAELQMLATTLANQVGRPVIDKTDLKGKYDFKLEWTPDLGSGEGMGAPPPGVDAPPPPKADGPTLFTALQEQLGLRLEPQKAPVETIVIDRIEKPSEN